MVNCVPKLINHPLPIISHRINGLGFNCFEKIKDKSKQMKDICPFRGVNDTPLWISGVFQARVEFKPMRQCATD